MHMDSFCADPGDVAHELGRLDDDRLGVFAYFVSMITTRDH